MDTIKKTPPRAPYITSTGYGFMASDTTLYRWECPWCGSHGQADHDKKTIQIRLAHHEQTCPQRDTATAQLSVDPAKPGADETVIACSHADDYPMTVELPGLQVRIRFCQPCMTELYLRLFERLGDPKRIIAEQGAAASGGQSLARQQDEKNDPRGPGVLGFVALDRATDDSFAAESIQIFNDMLADTLRTLDLSEMRTHLHDEYSRSVYDE